MRHLILAILLLSAAPICVAQNEPMISVFGIALLPCGDVLQAMERNKAAEQVYGAWLQGYIHGRNSERIARSEDARAGGKTTMDTLIAALKIQCQKDVFAPMNSAAYNIYQQVLPAK